MNRRDFLRTAALAPAALAALKLGCGNHRPAARRVIVLGIDGLDPQLVGKFAREGYMPNVSRLLRMAQISPLGTTIPPQSPVAWSGFITGRGPEVHGIYDFIHRDPATRSPYLATSRVQGTDKFLNLGKWRLPLSGAKVELLRKGEPFWTSITSQGIPVSMIKLPVDFPPPEGRARILSGLGTPDLKGSQGSFTFFTDDPRSLSDDTSGGVVVPVRDYGDGRYQCRIIGPENTMIEGNPDMEVNADVWIDRVSKAVRIDVCGSRAVLGEGEWSPWVRLSFDAIPGLSSVSGIVRFYLKQTTPHLKLYVTPVNMDPADPALPISHPDSLSRRLAEDLGPFYTQGFPEDTKARSRGILDDREYLQQAMIVLEERVRLLDHQLQRFDDGLLFFYFSSLDLNVHMFYRTIDPRNPLYETTNLERFGTIVRELYSKMDRAIGMAMEHLDERTELLAISDHGFAPFRRSFNLNSWLAREGYASLGSSRSMGRDMFSATDWSATAAYGLGLNGLYLNLRGREEGGSVDPSEADAVLRRIKRDLEAATDPLTGRRIVSRAYLTSEVFGPHQPPWAPDIVVGYSRGYRASWETTLGDYPEEVVTDNLDPWSGTHCVNPDVVPGTLISTVPLVIEDPRLADMGRSIAGLFEVPELPPGGRNVFESSG
ncbi:twin-arginine translocation signal domain-containing protein [Candidatus Fermentibacteria bacterium]|nr:twin-arginine translocation signal domain-containing protein [Candidatus Fermentibacteria bacterium]